MKSKLIISISVIALSLSLFLLISSDKSEEVVQLGDDQLQSLAENWINENAQTYAYDGQELKIISFVRIEECQNCADINYEFISNHGGFGNRQGKLITQVITPHTLDVSIKEAEVIKAITDEKFDEITQDLL